MSVYRLIAPVDKQFEVRVHEVRDGDVLDLGPYKVTARRLNHGAFNLGYAFEEPDRPGRFDKARALELGVPEGPLFRKLQTGQDVTTPGGTTVRSADVMGSPRKGRKIVITGDTAACQPLTELAEAADLLIAEGTYCNDMEAKAREYGHMTAQAAARTAQEARVRRLVLTHLSPRYTDDSTHLAEAREVFESTEVAHDLMTVEVPLVQ
jgi:ribonuclease Z